VHNKIKTLSQHCHNHSSVTIKLTITTLSQYCQNQHCHNHR